MKVALAIFAVGGLLAWMLWRSRQASAVATVPETVGPWGPPGYVPTPAPTGVKTPQKYNQDGATVKFGLGGITGITAQVSGSWIPGPNDRVGKLTLIDSHTHKAYREGDVVTLGADEGIVNGIENMFGAGNFGDKYTFINGTWTKGYWAKNAAGQWVGTGKHPGDPWSEGNILNATSTSNAVVVSGKTTTVGGHTYTEVDGKWVKGYWGKNANGQWVGTGQHPGDPWSKGQPLTAEAITHTLITVHGVQGKYGVYDTVTESDYQKV